MTSGHLADHIAVQMQRTEIDNLRKREQKLVQKVNQVKRDYAKLKEANKRIADQLAISRQNALALGITTS